ncbi:SDR family NAD(P)-dependent oxidoreductase [Amycolatopsis sp. DSM 110486]|uniref:SDR family NAD(P)-dependent oxidoreductase n=1 Tax=Amycolatopsis sp. DSM 110486 TaxID=2865832 RepID=UPI001C6A2769|nr:SDR family NAD(P)-dependent oxidoreductase [Amycolatopsis sp. DSM 110486]QYN18801.1 SDR family oxidoreductase [Amycolatopsis sp. DSM 110486]
MDRTLAGRTAVVTGGARGIGAGIVQRLAAEGATVAIWDRDLSGLVVSEAGTAFQVDVTDADSVARAHAATVAAVGEVDILVNNAGINGPVTPVEDYPPEAWRQVLEVDLTGVFLCTRAVLPGMKARRRGRILTVSSIVGKEGNPGISAYAAAKAGVIGFTKSLARELGDNGVLVNCIAPAITETEFFRQLTPEHIAASKAKIPLGRFLTVAEIAAMVAFVVGPDCTFTNGFTFDLSGGRATY